MGVREFEIDVSAEMVTGDGGREVQEGEGGGGYGHPYGSKLCLPLRRICGPVLFGCYTGTIPNLFLYIDDIIGAASCSHEEPEQFNFTSTLLLNLKFTWTISNTSLPFLDLSISISGIHRTSSNLVFCIHCSRCGVLHSVNKDGPRQIVGDLHSQELDALDHFYLSTIYTDRPTAGPYSDVHLVSDIFYK
eukprot:g48268.t1